MNSSLRAVIFSCTLILALLLAPVSTVHAVTVPAEINKSFTPIAITAGGTSVLRVTIYNLNQNDLTSAMWIDNMPAGITVANPANVVNTCGVVADVREGGGGPLNPGDASFMLQNGTVPAAVSGFPGECYVEVDVTSMTPGNLINTIPAGDPDPLLADPASLHAYTIDPDGPATPVFIWNTTPASATLNVIGVQAPSLFKSFLDNTIFAGATTTLTIRIHNNDTTYSLHDVTVTDTLPTGGNGDVQLASPVNASLSGCGAGTLEDSGGGGLSPGDTDVVLVGGTIAPDSDCTITVDVNSAVQGAYVNTIPAGPAGGTPGAIETREGVTNASPASANLNVQAFTLTKAFATSPISAGGTSDVTITIQNHAPFPYAGADLDDVLPSTDLEWDTLSGATTCGGGAVSFPTAQTIRLLGGTIPANSSCTITGTVNALSSAAGTYMNDIPIGALHTTLGATNHAPASADLTVTSLTISKAFSPTTFAAGQTTTLTITITNPTSNTFTNASVSDTLPTSPNSELYFTGVPTTDCEVLFNPATVDFFPTIRTVRLTNGTIPANGSCTITALVTTDADAPEAAGYNNVIPIAAISTTEGASNTAPASATVDVTTISVGKTFNPTGVTYPNASMMTITITNPATGGPLTGITFTDTLTAGLEVAPHLGDPGPPPGANPAPTTSCTGGVLDDGAGGTLDGGDTVIRLTGGTLPAGLSTCTVVVYVRPTVGAASRNYLNVLGPGSVTTNEGPTNSNNTGPTLGVTSVGVSKAFLYANFEAGGTNTLTITITNPTGAAYTGVSLLDNLPGSFTLASPVNYSLNGCGEPVATLTDSLGGVLDISDTSVLLNNGTVAATPPGTNCVITVDVTSSVPGSYTNTITPANLTIPGGPTIPSSVTAPVTVYTVGQGVPSTKTFSPGTINIFGSSTLELTFTAPADTSLSGFTVTDTLPAGLFLATPVNQSLTNCGTGTLDDGAGNALVGGETTIRLINGSFAASTTCIVEVDVTSITGSTAGINYVNTIQPGDVSSNEGRTMPGPITDTLVVQSPPDLEVTKAFYPDIVNPNGLSTLTITLENSNAADLINVSLTDTLPGTATDGVVVAPIPNASTNCGAGAVTALAGSQTITMTGGTIPAQVGGVNGICTILVDVQGKSTNGAVPTTHNNIIPATNVLAQISGNPSTLNANSQANDTITVRDLDLEIVKGFDPQLVFGGADSEMSIILRNPNTGELVNISFTDDLPYDSASGDAMILSNPTNFDASDCDPPVGPPAVLTGTAGSGTFSFSGGYLAAGDSCTLTLNATMVVNGNRTNTIPAMAVTTFNGATNGTPTSATLTNLAGASIGKDFAPNPISAGLGSWSILTITIRTTATVAITGIGLVDGLPAGLEVAGGAAPAPTNGCGGTFSAPAGATSVQLSGGSLPIGFDTCILTVPVTGANPGTYTNTIPDNTLTNDQSVTNLFPASAQLTLTPYSLGNLVWFDTDNNGVVNGGEVGVQGVRVELYRDDGTTPGVFDAGDTYISFRNTNASGHYRFDDLGGGDYVVLIPSANFDTAGAVLSGYLSSGTSANASGVPSDSIGFPPNNDIDNDDNGVSTFSGQALNYVSSQVVTLGPGGSEPVNDNEPTTNPEPGEAVNEQSNRTVDFGFYRQQLGNQIFQDINENGVFDAGELPLSGATVQLFAGNGTTEINVGPDGILGTGDDAPGGITSTATGTPGNPTGNYLFSGLPEGNYVVKVLPTGFPSTVDTFNPGDTASPNVNEDDNDNGVGTTGGTAVSNPVTLTPGNSGLLGNNIVTGASGTTYNPTVDFGYVTNLEKRIFSTDAAHTVTPNVTIGEIITYDVLMKIPDGGLTNVQLVDMPQTGLAFVDCIHVDFSTVGIPLATCDTTDGTTPGSNPLIQNSGTLITFDLGNIPNATGTVQIVSVRYSLIVLNVIGNQSGDSLTNNVTWNWTGGSRITSAPQVNIVEPELTIDKDATPILVNVGDTVTFTIDVAHAITSLADAFDVTVIDQIPSGLTFNPASYVYSGSAAAPTYNYDLVTNRLTLFWDVIRLTETASIQFQAFYNGPPPVINSTTVDWSSIEIDPIPGPPPAAAQRSAYNTSATERWFDSAAPAVDSYVASASVTINPQSTTVPDQIPDTGFAPGKVTILPEQPATKAYADLGDLWLEIPSLNVKTPIVGVPRAGISWDIKWLWDQAGFLEGTAFPTRAGNSVLTAHVFTPDGLPGPFADLHNLSYGDQVIVHAYGQRYIYEVQSNRRVSPRANVFEHEELPWVTLVTCQGYNEVSDSYRYRVIVRAVQVRIEPE
jgi:LPXTG-site transpeptidase (sortase) family protein